MVSSLSLVLKILCEFSAMTEFWHIFYHLEKNLAVSPNITDYPLVPTCHPVVRPCRQTTPQRYKQKQSITRSCLLLSTITNFLLKNHNQRILIKLIRKHCISFGVQYEGFLTKVQDVTVCKTDYGAAATFSSVDSCSRDLECRKTISSVLSLLSFVQCGEALVKG